MSNRSVQAETPALPHIAISMVQQHTAVDHSSSSTTTTIYNNSPSSPSQSASSYPLPPPVHKQQQPDTHTIAPVPTSSFIYNDISPAALLDHEFTLHQPLTAHPVHRNHLTAQTSHNLTLTPAPIATAAEPLHLQDDIPKKVPRPDNPFFIYKREMKDKVASENPGKNSAELSKIMGQMWSSLTKEEKQYYTAKAEERRLEHMKKYPDYKYCPKPRKNKKPSDMRSVNQDKHSTSTHIHSIVTLQQQQQQQHNAMYPPHYQQVNSAHKQQHHMMMGNTIQNASSAAGGTDQFFLVPSAGHSASHNGGGPHTHLSGSVMNPTAAASASGFMPHRYATQQGNNFSHVFSAPTMLPPRPATSATSSTAPTTMSDSAILKASPLALVSGSPFDHIAISDFPAREFPSDSGLYSDVVTSQPPAYPLHFDKYTQNAFDSFYPASSVNNGQQQFMLQKNQNGSTIMLLPGMAKLESNQLYSEQQQQQSATKQAVINTLPHASKTQQSSSLHPFTSNSTLLSEGKQTNENLHGMNGQQVISQIDYSTMMNVAGTLPSTNNQQHASMQFKSNPQAQEIAQGYATHMAVNPGLVSTNYNTYGTTPATYYLIPSSSSPAQDLSAVGSSLFVDSNHQSARLAAGGLYTTAPMQHQQSQPVQVITVADQQSSVIPQYHIVSPPHQQTTDLKPATAVSPQALQ